MAATVQRLLVGKPGTLSVTIVDSLGSPVTATGALTVGVISASGQAIIAPGTATTAGANPGVYTVSVSAAQAAKLDQWTATWTDAGNGSTQTSDHEVVGGFFFSLADVRASDSVLADATKYPDGVILAARQSVEEECEFICDVPFVPRYRRVLCDGTAEPEIFVLDSKIRAIRSATIFTANSTGQALVLTTAQLAALVIDDDFKIQRNDGGIWTEGRRNVVIEYECGWDAPPGELAAASLIRLRSVLNRQFSSVPDRATSFVTEGGTTFRLDTPHAFATGIPEVDAVYNRYSTREYDDADPLPASQSIQADPSWFSIYHGGRR
jgi:hypothetical protein